MPFCCQEYDKVQARIGEIQEKARMQGLDSLTPAEVREWADLRGAMLNIDASRNLVIQTVLLYLYTLWISRWIATARERIPGSIDNYVTGVSECSQQRGNLQDDEYTI
ncbi:MULTISPECIES: hypothetical protein [Photorhabdus]|uniref:Uncharacterized protein n=1 Tax=Photorhabdus kayaii TaxID=230088 RepID=A0ABX0B091_9GAMM|nr:MULTISPECIES: hypothetical protein [Photorhabdus]MCT8353071.1 hypothetical protein [Photorhabdus kayaii]NDL10485.1 hypothetical protein [Photorhabdus kayaii]NDL23951.1 hypothetical protein [Photorhabdus kayaii]RAX12145.1 hypothetical protein CKY10_02745 [Photorhabdus sp. HUG-39]